MLICCLTTLWIKLLSRHNLSINSSKKLISGEIQSPLNSSNSNRLGISKTFILSRLASCLNRLDSCNLKRHQMDSLTVSSPIIPMLNLNLNLLPSKLDSLQALRCLTILMLNSNNSQNLFNLCQLVQITHLPNSANPSNKLNLPPPPANHYHPPSQRSRNSKTSLSLNSHPPSPHKAPPSLNPHPPSPKLHHNSKLPPNNNPPTQTNWTTSSPKETQQGSIPSETPANSAFPLTSRGPASSTRQDKDYGLA